MTFGGEPVAAGCAFMVQAATIQPSGEFQFLGWPRAFLRDRRTRQDRSTASKIGRSEQPAQRTLDRKRGTARVGILSHVGNDLKSAVMRCRAGNARGAGSPRRRHGDPAQNCKRTWRPQVATSAYSPKQSFAVTSGKFASGQNPRRPPRPNNLVARAVSMYKFNV
jgi:hypothetical protein